MNYGFLGVGNGMINSFSTILDKVKDNPDFGKVLNLFAFSIDTIFVFGIVLSLLGILISGIQYYYMQVFKDDENKYQDAKGKFKKSVFATIGFICIPIVVSIIGFIIASSGTL